GLHHLALLHAPARNRLLDRDDDHVADRGVALLGAAEHLDAHDPTRAGIIRHVEVGLHLDHDALPALVAALTTLMNCAHTTLCFLSPSIPSQRLSRDSGRRSSIRTTSPTENSFFSSWA